MGYFTVCAAQVLKSENPQVEEIEKDLGGVESSTYGFSQRKW